MSHPTLFYYPRPRVDIAEVPAVSHAGAVLLTDTIHATGLAASLREALTPWTKPLAEHHASKVLLDLAMTLAVGGEVARDTDLLRCEPGLFGDVASTPTISRMLTTLAEDTPAVIVAELTGLLDLSGWPEGMRVIVRKERPHPGAQLRITDHEGMRITAFATNTPRGQLPVLELRHRRRARCEDRIRNAKDMGLLKFPLQSFAQNQLWCQVVQLASELVAWMQTLAFTSDDARKWEPKRLRARVFEVPATLVRRCRHKVLHLAQHPPEAVRVLTGVNRLRTAVAQT